MVPIHASSFAAAGCASGILAVPSSATFCAPSHAPARTAGPLRARSSCQRRQLVAPAHTAPLCTPLRCSTKHNSVGMFRWNQFLSGLLSSRRNAAHAALTGLFCMRRLDRATQRDCIASPEPGETAGNFENTDRSTSLCAYGTFRPDSRLRALRHSRRIVGAQAELPS